MPIEFRCTGCQKLLRVPDATAGKQAKCPECGMVLQIPAASTSAPAPNHPAATGGAAAAFDPAAVFNTGGAAPQSSAEQNNNPFAAPQTFDFQSSDQPIGAGELVATRINVFDILGEAMRIAIDQFGNIILASLIVALLYIVGAAIQLMIQMSMIGSPMSVYIPIILFLALASIVYNAWIFLGFTKFSLAVARNEPLDLGILFSTGRYIGTAIGAALLVALMSIGLLFAMGLVVAFVAGLTGSRAVMVVLMIVVYIGLIAYLIGLSQVYPLIVDRDFDAMRAIKVSLRVMRGNRLATLAIFLIAALLSAFVGGLIYFVLGLVVQGMIAAGSVAATVFVAVVAQFIPMLLIGPFYFALFGVLHLGVTGQLGRPRNG